MDLLVSLAEEIGGLTGYLTYGRCLAEQLAGIEEW